MHPYSLCDLIALSIRRLRYLVRSGAPLIVIRLEKALLKRRIDALGEPRTDSLHPEGR